MARPQFAASRRRTIAPSVFFGETLIGSVDSLATSDSKNVFAATAPVTGTISKFTGYLSGLGSGVGSQPFRVVIYADSSGNPGALLKISDEVIILDSSAFAWYDFILPTPLAVTAGTTYWIGYYIGSPNQGSQIKGFSGFGLKFNTNNYA